MCAALIDRDALCQLIRTQTIGRRIEVHETLESTNRLARSRAGDAANHGLVIFAEHQTAGRGRGNHAWHSPRGASLLCSALLILDPESCPARSVGLWVPLAIRDAILQSCNLDSVIKWPNDIMVANKKVCGILIESCPAGPRQRALIIGIGLNCLQHRGHFPPEIRARSTSLDLESGVPVDRQGVAQVLLGALDHRFAEAARISPAQLRQEWMAHSLPLGQRVVVSSGDRCYAGSLIELDLEGGIVVQLDQGGRRLFSPFVTSIEQIG